MRALKITPDATLVRPLPGGGLNEIVNQPRHFRSDTGFVVFARGWESLRPVDCGPLWEPIVLETLQSALPDGAPGYCGDEVGYNLDFVLRAGRDEADAIE